MVDPNGWAFMLFGFGFFLFTLRLVSRDHREAEQRRIMEAREFGKVPPRKRFTNWF